MTTTPGAYRSGPHSDLTLDVVIDNSDGLRRVRSGQTRRNRTIGLWFRRFDDGYELRAYGDEFPDDGGGGYSGRLDLRKEDVDTYIEQLRDTWTHRFLGFQRPGTFTYPFSERTDLTDPSLDQAWNEQMRSLAHAGYRLFDLLFKTGDKGLRQIGDRLEHALRERDQVISIESEHLFAPWWMLYIPPRPEPGLLEGPDASWEMKGFVAYRHLLEHTFARNAEHVWTPRITYSGTVNVGLNIDRGLDNEYPDNPPVQPIVDLFSEQCAAPTIRESRVRFATDIVADDFRDGIIGFVCHGNVDGPATQPHLALTDREPIYTSDFERWLGMKRLEHNPVVLMLACQGGRLSSLARSSFSRVMLEKGANCLIGPQIDLPPAFAVDYARAFIPRLLKGERIGDIARDLAVEFADHRRNPLGLAMSLYRGLDTHLVRIDDGS